MMINVLLNDYKWGFAQQNLTGPINQGWMNWGGGRLTACTWWSAVLH